MSSTSPQHKHEEEILPSSWKQLRRLNEAAADLGFHDYLSTAANADTNATEVLNDEEIVQLASGAQQVSEDAEDPETAEAPVPAPGQVMDALNVLVWHEKSVRPMITKRTQV